MGGRRDVCAGQNPQVRREPAPFPANPTRRSAKKCVAKTDPLCAPIDMVSEQETNETRIEDEFDPGIINSLFVSSSHKVIWSFDEFQFLLAGVLPGVKDFDDGI